MLSLRIPLLLLCLTQSANADNSAEVKQQLSYVSEYFAQNNPRELYKAQALLQAYGVYKDKVDGKWGKKTEKVFLDQLDTYISIGGVGEEWGVRNPAETIRFLNWIADSGLANANGTAFPD
jgi:hypothetical protein